MKKIRRSRTILALDLGAKTGYCILRDGKVTERRSDAHRMVERAIGIGLERGCKVAGVETAGVAVLGSNMIKPVRRPRTILALDLGAKTGYCTLVDGKVTEHGMWFFPGTRPERLYGLRRKLQPIFARNWPHPRIDAAVYETPFCRGPHATRSLWGMAGVVEAVACGSAAVLDVNIQVIKKWAGAKGSQSKTITLDKCVELGVIPLDDNHADAVCLAFYALDHMEIE